MDVVAGASALFRESSPTSMLTLSAIAWSNRIVFPCCLSIWLNCSRGYASKLSPASLARAPLLGLLAGLTRGSRSRSEGEGDLWRLSEDRLLLTDPLGVIIRDRCGDLLLLSDLAFGESGRTGLYLFLLGAGPFPLSLFGGGFEALRRSFMTSISSSLEDSTSSPLSLRDGGT